MIGLPAVIRDDTIGLPAANNRIKNWVHPAPNPLSTPNRKLIDVAELEDVRYVIN